MKKLYPILFAAALALCGTACQKEKTDTAYPAPIDFPGEDRCFIKATQESGRWTGNESLRVIGENSVVFSVINYSASTAVLAGEGEVRGSSFTILSPSALESEAAFDHFNYQRQTLPRSGSTEHIVPCMAIKGVNAYKDITINESWASGGGGYLLKSGTLTLDITFPKSFLILDSLSISCPGRKAFYGNNLADSAVDSIVVKMPSLDPGLRQQNIVVPIQMSGQSVVFGAEDKIVLRAWDGEKSIFKTITPGETRWAGGSDQTLAFSKLDWNGAVDGDNNKDDPYMLYTADDMVAMHDKLRSDFTCYFKMANDIDLADVDWVPLVTANALLPINFDGDGHVIKNLKVASGVSFPSFVGVLDGTIKNVTFKDAVIESDRTSVNQTAVVAGWAGRNAGDCEAGFDNVHVVNARVSLTQSVESPTGLMIGQGNGVYANNCSVQGSISAAGKNAEMNLGGFAGVLNGSSGNNNTLTGCSSDVNITCIAENARVVGGFIGSVRRPSVITDCSARGSVTGYDLTATTNNALRYSGGFIGYIPTVVTIKNCSAEVNFNNISEKSGLFVGNITPAGNGSVFEHNECTGSATYINGANVGGLIGYLQADITVKACHFGGSLAYNDLTYDGTPEGCNKTSYWNAVGGIVGNLASGNVFDCYCNGDVRGNSGVGGICGWTGAGCRIANCYMTGKVDGCQGLGAIAGMACGQNVNIAQDSNKALGIEVYGCLGWASSLTSSWYGDAGGPGLIPSDRNSAGWIIGKTAPMNILHGCYRPSYATTIPDARSQEAYDQESSDGSTSLTFNGITNDNNYSPYFGKAAATTATVSSLARELGWSEEIWDLSGNFPALK